jgi:hypothetical protein
MWTAAARTKFPAVARMSIDIADWERQGPGKRPGLLDQNCRPPSRAASASALMRPW